MRTNCREVLAAFLNGKSKRSAQSIWTNGDQIYSYGTCLVQKIGKHIILNRTKYSITTTIHQNALAAALHNPIYAANVLRVGNVPEDLILVEVDGVPRGCSDLKNTKLSVL